MSIAWCLVKEDVASKLQNDQTVKVEISVAEVPQPFSNVKAATPQSNNVNKLVFKRLDAKCCTRYGLWWIWCQTSYPINNYPQ